jgi:hypothetical protein
MIEVARPAFLWAGALLAGLPLLLHFLRPRERARRTLPTLRFLAPDPRTRPRLRRRPDELLLLAMRVGLCLALGAAFAGLAWVGPAAGTGVLVVVDGGAAMAGVWEEARETIPAGFVELVVVRPGPEGLPRVARFGPDRAPDPAQWAELAPGDGEVRLAHLVRALRDGAARATGVDSLTARIVTVPRWGAWGPGVVELRRELWPAAIELTVPGGDVPGPEGDTPSPQVEESPPVSVTLEAPEGVREAMEEALGVLGVAMAAPAEAPTPVETTPPEPATSAAGLHVRLRAGPEDTLGEPWDATRPWGAIPGADVFLLLDGRTLPGGGAAPSGRPAEGALVPLLRAGGRPAAAALAGPGECRVALPLEPDAPILGSGELVLLLESLIAEGCPTPGGARLPVGRTASPGGPDAGAAATWRAFLAGDGVAAGPAEEALPSALEARPLRGPEAGVPLTRILLGVALVLALLEVLRSRSAQAARSRGGAGTGAGAPPGKLSEGSG